MGRNRRTGKARPTKRAGAIEKVDTAGKAGLRPATTDLLLGLLIVLAGMWAYSNSLDGVFVLDDVRAIVLNPTLHSFSDAFSPPPQSTVSGRPIANLSFAINRTFGDGPRSFHVANIAIHVLAALLVFGVVRRTLLTTPMYSRFGDVSAPLAFAVALIWVVHPLTTSAVTYVVQRVESLMALFYLLTVYAAIRAVTAPSERDHRRLWAAIAIVSCALGDGDEGGNGDGTCGRRIVGVGVRTAEASKPVTARPHRGEGGVRAARRPRSDMGDFRRARV